MKIKTLVIIEDNPDVRSMLSDAAEPYFVNVVSFESTEEAKSWIAEATDFLILSDIDLPGMDGLEHLKNFRTSGRTEPFILMSGRDEVSSKDLETYDSTFFAKPFSFSYFIRFLNSFVNRPIKFNSEQG